MPKYPQTRVTKINQLYFSNYSNILTDYPQNGLFYSHPAELKCRHLLRTKPVIPDTIIYLRARYPFNPHAPVAQKVADEVVFRRFQGEGVEFFLIGPHWPPSDFWCASFEKYQFKPFQLSFFSGFLYRDLFWFRWFYTLSERMRLRGKTMFIHINQSLITSFYIKKTIFCTTGVWGVNRSSVWGLKCMSVIIRSFQFHYWLNRVSTVKKIWKDFDIFMSDFWHGYWKLPTYLRLTHNEEGIYFIIFLVIFEIYHWIFKKRNFRNWSSLES